CDHQQGRICRPQPELVALEIFLNEGVRFPIWLEHAAYRSFELISAVVTNLADLFVKRHCFWRQHVTYIELRKRRLDAVSQEKWHFVSEGAFGSVHILHIAQM